MLIAKNLMIAAVLRTAILKNFIEAQKYTFEKIKYPAVTKQGNDR